MRIHIVFTTALAALLFASATNAQSDSTAIENSPRAYGGISVLGAAPRGDFADQIDRAFGVGVHALYRLDSAGRIAIRLDASWLNHGWDRKDVALISPLGGTREVDLTTTNNLMFVGVGPELSASLGKLRPYAGANAGIAYFLTDASGVDRDDAINVATSVQHQDVVFSYGGHAGVAVPLSIGTRSVALDLGARYQHSDEAQFLREGDLAVQESGTISLDPVTSSADVWVFYAGVSIALARR